MTDPFTNPRTVEQGSSTKAEPKRDRWGRYLMPTFNGSFNPETYGPRYGHQRVTTFAKLLSDTFGLAQWKTRMALKGVSLRPDLYAQIAACSIDDSSKLNALAEKGQEAAGSSKGAGLGTALHAFTERVDLGEITPADVPAPWDKDVEAYVSKVREYGFEFPREFIEVVLVNEKFGLGGTADRIARLTKALSVEIGGKTITMPAGTWVIVDVKTGKDLSYSMGDISIQLGPGYACADAGYDFGTSEFFPLPKMDRRVGFVIHVPAGKGTTEVIPVDLTAGIEAAEHAAFVRDWRKRKNLAGKATPANDDASQPTSNIEFYPRSVDEAAMFVAAHAPDGVNVDPWEYLVELINESKSRNELLDIRQKNLKYWTADLDLRCKRRVAELDLFKRLDSCLSTRALDQFESKNMDNPSWTDELTEAVVRRRKDLSKISLVDMIKACPSTDRLTELWQLNRSEWRQEHTRAAAARKAELS